MARLNCCKAGSVLLKLFLTAVCLFGGLYLYDFFAGGLGFTGWSRNRTAFLVTAVLLVVLCAALFWTGLILLYTTCDQLRLKKRVLGLVLAWVPVANLVMLIDLIVTADREYRFEKARLRRDAARREQQICRTRYPLLLVHGVFFRDFKHLNYWGRIPKALEQNGAQIFYGEHNSASSVAESAAQLKERITRLVNETGCGKVNIIAHSKGGLDARCLLSDPSAAACVASVTTINAPHRGCKFADWLLEKVPARQQEQLARAYNAAAARLGDREPDFLAAVRDLTAESCRERNKVLRDPEGVLCRSVGSVQRRAVSGRFPLNLTHRFVKYFDGENDGLVGTGSFAWGERLTMLRASGRRGISHGDVIDLNRENIPGFDVREFYVQLAAELKEAGL